MVGNTHMATPSPVKPRYKPTNQPINQPTSPPPCTSFALHSRLPSHHPSNLEGLGISSISYFPASMILSASGLHFFPLL